MPITTFVAAEDIPRVPTDTDITRLANVSGRVGRRRLVPLVTRLEDGRVVVACRNNPTFWVRIDWSAETVDGYLGDQLGVDVGDDDVGVDQVRCLAFTLQELLDTDDEEPGTDITTSNEGFCAKFSTTEGRMHVRVDHVRRHAFWLQVDLPCGM